MGLLRKKLIAALPRRGGQGGQASIDQASIDIDRDAYLLGRYVGPSFTDAQFPGQTAAASAVAPHRRR
jgi:hypothetical protein